MCVKERQWHTSGVAEMTANNVGRHNNVRRERGCYLKASQFHTVLSNTNQRKEHCWDFLKYCTSRLSLIAHIISVQSSVPILLSGTSHQLDRFLLVQTIEQTPFPVCPEMQHETPLH